MVHQPAYDVGNSVCDTEIHAVNIQGTYAVNQSLTMTLQKISTVLETYPLYAYRDKYQYIQADRAK